MIYSSYLTAGFQLLYNDDDEYEYDDRRRRRRCLLRVRCLRQP